MFNLEENKNEIMKLIDSREADEYVIPVYVKMYNDRYFLHELDQIKQFNPAAFKVGFGSSVGLFIKNSFPNQMLLNFSEARAFSDVDENTGVATRYVLFEANEKDNGDSVVDQQIILYAERIREYLEKQSMKYREELLKSQMDSE